MKLILHIGHAKTGTSSIQQTLKRCSRQLLERGVLYYPGPHESHFGLVSLISDRFGLHTAARDALRESMTRLPDAMEHLARRHAPRFVLVSAETLFPLSPHEIEQLLRLLPGSDGGVHVVAYLRQPSALYLSTMQQRLKTDHRLLAPQNFRLDYCTGLAAWRGFAGCGLHLRAFSRHSLTGGDVVRDFFELLEGIVGTPLADLAETGRAGAAANVSLAAEQMFALQRFRKEFLPRQAGVFHEDANALLRFFEACRDSPALPWTPPRLRPEIAAGIDHLARDCIAELDAAHDTSLLQSFGMETGEAASLPRAVAVPQVLRHCDLELMALLESCMPCRNPALAEDPTLLPCEAAESDLRFAAAWAGYLLDCGLEQNALHVLGLHAKRLHLASPGELAALHAAGDALARLGRHAEALAFFRQAAALKPVDPRTHFLLSHALLRCGQREQALEAARSAARLEPQHGHLAHLGALLERAGDRAGAAEAYRQAIAHDPAPEGPYLALAGLHAEADEPEQALELLQEAQTLHGASPQGLCRQGRLLAAAGREQEASQILAEALRLDPAWPEPWALLLRLQLRAREFGQALETARAALAHGHDHPALRKDMARALAGSGSRLAALRVRLQLLWGALVRRKGEEKASKTKKPGTGPGS